MAELERMMRRIVDTASFPARHGALYKHTLTCGHVDWRSFCRSGMVHCWQCAELEGLKQGDLFDDASVHT